MKNNYLTKSVVIKLCTVLLVGISLFIIHSCKKDIKSAGEASAQITDPEILQAKTWYDGAYPVSADTKVNLKTQSTASGGVPQNTNALIKM